MKKYTQFIFTIFAALLPTLLFAQGKIDITFQSPIKSPSVSEVLVKFFDVLVEIGAVAVVLAVVYAGFLFVAAKGNPQELQKAKTTLYWTIIGSLILLGAQVIATIIKTTIEKL
jgi:type II secretory pathway component PulF